MKKSISYYAVFGAVILMLLNVVDFAVTADSGMFDRHGFDFILKLAVYDIAVLANIVLAGVAFNASSKKPVKGRTDVLNYTLIVEFGLSLLGITFVGVVFMLIDVLPAFIGAILVALIVLYNLYITLLELGNLDKVLGFFKSKLFYGIIVPGVAFVVAAVLLTVMVLVPTLKYNGAIKKSDSGDKKSAVLSLFGLDGYKDSENKIKELITEDSSLAIYAAKVGDTVKFGKYEQDNDAANGKEDIEWFVLDRDGNRVLLMSVYTLDCQPYNTEYVSITWEKCTLRKWLNDTFYNTAFDDAQKASIMTKKLTNPTTQFSKRKVNGGKDTNDNVFLLSINEGNSYCVPREKYYLSKATAYAKAQGVYANAETSYCWWWLRSPGADTTVASSANINEYTTEGFNKINGRVDTKNYGVRPCVWVDLEK
ncbi:MAG: hypothetical protein KBS52_00125 [Clostridiales bacterium]|nr:hypothetical protein [Candidatus Equinaster intestinalis]